MNYEETLQYLYARLPMFQRIGGAAYKADLTKTIRLVDLLGNPQDHLRFIHIAGTNGKGSVSHLLASVLQSSGFTTGLFTSPHLKDYRERIRVDGRMIPKGWVSQFISYFRREIEPIAPSFFEMTFAMALRYFKEQGVDVVVLETGMGGRLDSTNIVHPLVSVITNISLDHQEFLGKDVEMIAVEKAGIIKPETPVVIGRRQASTDELLCFKAEVEGAPVRFASDHYSVGTPTFAGATRRKIVMDVHRNGISFIKGLRCPLTGLYQRENIATVFQVTEELIRMGFDIRKHHLLRGINDVVKQTGLLGRYQILGREPLVICDTAHNADGINQVLFQLRQETFTRLHFVLGMVGDKDIGRILKLLPLEGIYYFCKADIPRGLDAKELSVLASRAGLHGIVYQSVGAAYQAALSAASPQDLVFVGGSTFTVAEVL
jgi:dihydrofolate synthase / folylpolyglutamate synthase